MFQDRISGKNIGFARELDGLFYLEKENKVTEVYNASEINFFLKWLWHHRLGHLLFHNVKRLFLDSCNKMDFSKFICEECELAKSHKVSYPLSNFKNNIPFNYYTF